MWKIVYKDNLHQKKLTMKIKAEKSNSKQTSSLLVLEGKTVKDIPKLSRLEFLDKFLANNFALSDAEDNISVE